MTPLHFLWFVLFSTLATHGLFAAPAHVATFPASVKRVVIFGDSITYGGTYVVYLEAYFRTRHPAQTLEFINLGLPSETVSGLSEEGHAGGKFPRPVLRERLTRSLEATSPDYVIACYGMNDGIYLPLSEDRFRAFRDGITELRDAVTKRALPFLLVTPPNYDPKGDAHNTYNHVLARYGQWELAQKKAGWDVVELNGAMTEQLKAKRRTDPEYAFAKDGVHPNADGHWIMARQILLHLGAGDLVGIEDGKGLVANLPHGEDLLTLIGKRQSLVKDAWLNQIGHERPGMKKSPPLAELEPAIAELNRDIRALIPEQATVGVVR